MFLWEQNRGHENVIMFVPLKIRMVFLSPSGRETPPEEGSVVGLLLVSLLGADPPQRELMAVLISQKFLLCFPVLWTLLEMSPLSPLFACLHPTPSTQKFLFLLRQGKVLAVAVESQMSSASNILYTNAGVLSGASYHIAWHLLSGYF